VRYGANEVVLNVVSETGGLLLLSDVYYPGWTAEIDGAPSEVIRADVTLRAVCVPAGSRTVVMRFAPASLAAGALTTLAALGLLGGVTFLGGRRRTRR
jgi:uncharacterized membrane protein YfhO